MKKLTIYLLIIGFAAQSASQLLVLAAFYIQRDYIAENLCINRFEAIPMCKGQCYLTKELHETEKKQERQFPDLKQKEIQLFRPESTVIACGLGAASGESIPSACDLDIVSAGFVHGVFHPPRMI